MKSSHYLFSLFVLIVLIGLVNYTAIYLHIYWSVHGFDKVVHFFGGLWAGLLGLWVFFLRFSGAPRFKEDKIIPGYFSPIKTIFITAVLSGLFIGVFWEIFELFVHANMIFSGTKSFAIDTIGDLVADTIGSIAAGSLFFILEKRDFEQMKI
jgi:uncharacterized membrane protein YjdF